jgi:hypothetical protein
MTYFAHNFFASNYFTEDYFGGGAIQPVIPDAYTPFFPPIEPYVLPRANFEGIINAYGVDLTWYKSHSCPCIYGGQQEGSPDPSCLTCRGRGVYWDGASAVFRGLITFIHTSPTPDEPGSMMSTQQGLITNGEPALTITDRDSTVWQEASIYDLFVEVNAVSRFNANLQVGGQTYLPYPQQVTVAPTGAVTVWNPTTHRVDSAPSYTVTGSQVVLNDYPIDTAYMVEFTAATTYVAYRVAGAPPHVRPFGNVAEPRRMRLQALDLWLRSKGQGDL